MTPLRPKTFGSIYVISNYYFHNQLYTSEATLLHIVSGNMGLIQVSEVVEAQKQSGTGLESFKELVYDVVRSKLHTLRSCYTD